MRTLSLSVCLLLATMCAIDVKRALEGIEDATQLAMAVLITAVARTQQQQAHGPQPTRHSHTHRPKSSTSSPETCLPT